MAPPESEQSATNGTSKPAFERLPKDVIPKNYQIRVEPDLEKFTFTGTETIEVEIKKDTDKIIVNSADIQVQSASYSSAGSSDSVPAQNIELRESEEKLILTFPSVLKAGTTGQVKISYTGTLNDKNKGFYRAKYPGTDGSPDKYAAVTQFEVRELPLNPLIKQ